MPGLQRIRLSSIEPMQLSRRVIALAANCKKIAPHFHICLQSGSDRILKKMFRPYKTSRFSQIVEEISRCIPDAAIGTDVIAGFPGESEEDHRHTVEFIGRMPITYLHVFPYSDRSGTAASRMAEKVDSLTIKRRSRELRQISEDKNRAFRRRFLGQSLSVLTLSETKDGMRTALFRKLSESETGPLDTQQPTGPSQGGGRRSRRLPGVGDAGLEVWLMFQHHHRHRMVGRVGDGDPGCLGTQFIKNFLGSALESQ